MRNLIVLASIVAITGVAVVVLTEEKTMYTDIALANIEALTGDENTSSDSEKEQEECSRIKSSATCYHSVKGTICNVRITAVEKYTRTSLVEVCDHYIITYCNGNCTENKP